MALDKSEKCAIVGYQQLHKEGGDRTGHVRLSFCPAPHKCPNRRKSPRSAPYNALQRQIHSIRRIGTNPQ